MSEKRTLNVLFTCAGRRVAVMDAFRDAMKRLGVQGRILAGDLSSASAAYHKADKGVLLPEVGSDGYADVLVETVEAEGIGLLVPMTDLDLHAVACARDRLGDAGCTAMIGSRDVVDACQDKIRTNELVKAAGLDPIRTLTLDAFLSDPFYPCFVKPIRGSGGVGTGAIADADALDAHVGTFGRGLIVQEAIPGREYTIDVYRDRGGEVRCVVPRQRLAVRSGEVEKGVTVRDAELIEAATRLSGELGDMWGVFCCQCRRVPGGPPRFFEINPRFGGGAPLSVAAGADLPLYLLEEVLGRPVSARPGEFTDGLLMLRYDDAVFVDASGDPDALPGFDTPLFR